MMKMARKRYKPEEIVAKLRQVDILVSQGQNMVDAIRQIGVSEVTYYRCPPSGVRTWAAELSRIGLLLYNMNGVPPTSPRCSRER